MTLGANLLFLRSKQYKTWPMRCKNSQKHQGKIRITLIGHECNSTLSALS